jgi:hypothetical protein
VKQLLRKNCGGVGKMAGRIKQQLDTILSERTQGSLLLLKTLKTKLILKGINPDKYTEESEDDPVIIAKLDQVILDFNQTKQRFGITN